MSHWQNFVAIILVQIAFLFFIYKNSQHKKIVSKIIPSALIGLIFGAVFDFIFGYYLNIFRYYIGFNIPFLIVNEIFSYGVMVLTVWLCFRNSFWKFYSQMLFLGIVYEIGNYIFPVWSWHFTENFIINEIILISCAYFGLAIIIAIIIKLMQKIILRSKSI